MRPIVSLLDTGVGPNPISADILKPSWLGSIRQLDMPYIRSVADTMLNLFATIIPLLHKDESCTHINIGVVSELVVPVLLVRSIIDILLK